MGVLLSVLKNIAGFNLLFLLTTLKIGAVLSKGLFELVKEPK